MPYGTRARAVDNALVITLVVATLVGVSLVVASVAFAYHMFTGATCTP